MSVALAYGAGIALGIALGAALGAGGGPAWIPLATAALLAGVAVSTVRGSPLLLTLAAGAGALAGPSTRPCVKPRAAPRAWIGLALEHQAAGAQESIRLRRHGRRACARDVDVYGLEQGAVAGSWMEVRGAWEEQTHPLARPVFVADTAVEVTPPRSGRDLAAEALVRVRSSLEGDVRRLLPERSPLLLAFLFARREQLDRDVREAFVRTGTAHLLAISGFHIGVVASVVMAASALAGAGVGGRVTAAAALCWLYVACLGFPRPAVRATLLLTALAAARGLGRPSRPLGVLSAALLAFLFVDPGGLSAAGTQLTFAATAGILLLRRPLDLVAGRVPWLGRRRLRALRASVVLSAAATVPTIPLLGWHFGEVSWLSIPATVLLTPLVSLAVVGGVLLLAVARVAPDAAPLLAGGVDVALAAVDVAVRGLSDLPVPTALVSRAGAFGVGVGLVTGALWSRWSSAALSAGGRLALGAVLSVVGGVTGPMVAHLTGNGALEIHMLDVGQGDATLLRSPRGRWVLVDAGPRGRSYDAGRRRVLPYLRSRGIQRLDRLVLTHADLDHVGGAPAVLARVPVRRVSDPGDVRGSGPYLAVLEAAQARGVPWIPLTAGARWEFDGAEIQVLGPPPLAGSPSTSVGSGNDRSLILLVRYGAFEALLTGDAPVPAELAVLESVPRALELLKVGHHGSATSTAPELLERARPRAALVSAGRRNRYGHPAPEVLARLRTSGARILRTDRDGHVRVRASDSGHFRIETQFGGS